MRYKQQTLGFYSKGKGKRRKVIPLTRRSKHKRRIATVVSTQRQDINTKVPSLATLREIHRENPKNLTDNQLLRKYASLQAVKIYRNRDALPNSYYRGIADPGGVTGKVPKDVMALVNLNETIAEYEKEIQNRNLEGKFDVIIQQKTQKTKSDWEIERWNREKEKYEKNGWPLKGFERDPKYPHIEPLESRIKGYKASLVLGREFNEPVEAYFERTGLKKFWEWKEYEKWHNKTERRNISPKLSNLLKKYKKSQEKIDVLSKETSAICATSGFGQAPPVFHRKVDQMVAIKEKKQSPLWEDLRHMIIPNSGYKTFWQEIPWTIGTLPPEYIEIEKAYAKYNSGLHITEIERRIAIAKES